MENATKALLIAAAVLIAIVLVALGVNLISSTGDTSKQAENVGSVLEDSSGSVADKITDSLKGTMTFTEAKVLLQEYAGPPTLNSFETSFGDFSYRVYKNDSKVEIKTLNLTEELWNNSEVIKTKPSGYFIQGTIVNKPAKRFAIVIAPEN